jgi:8-oxo-dGTP diphosphatase
VSIGRFQAGVAALIRRASDGKYLLLKRSAEKDYGAAAWECVTGRVDQGESFTTAVHREVSEELGEDTRVQLDLILGTTHFFRGAPSPANELLGVVYACTLRSTATLHTSSEHSEYRWLSAGEALEQFPPDGWLHRAIRRTETIGSLTSDALLGCYRQEGFEI